MQIQLKGTLMTTAHLIGKCSKGRRHNSTKIDKELHKQKQKGGNIATYAAISQPDMTP